MNYNDRETEYLVETYRQTPTPETVTMLADELGKSNKSIIGKLSREGVYQRSVYVSKSGEAPITKIDLVSLIASNLDLEDKRHLLEGLEKAPKQVLILLQQSTKDA
tara:strand:- start:232 stop:549 length:318 start_codon:yes stop_codon:yes gene_type:complete